MKLQLVQVTASFQDSGGSPKGGSRRQST